MEDMLKLGNPVFSIIVHAEVHNVEELEALVEKTKKLHQEYCVTLDVALK